MDWFDRNLYCYGMRTYGNVALLEPEEDREILAEEIGNFRFPVEKIPVKLGEEKMPWHCRRSFIKNFWCCRPNGIWQIWSDRPTQYKKWQIPWNGSQMPLEFSK